MEPDRAAAAAESLDACPRCGARFACGMASGRCWCSDLPSLAPLPADLPPACLCPACLRELSTPGAPARTEPR